MSAWVCKIQNLGVIVDGKIRLFSDRLNYIKGLPITGYCITVNFAGSRSESVEWIKTFLKNPHSIFSNQYFFRTRLPHELFMDKN